MLTLAIGDLYIPDRSIQLPAKFCKLLSPNPGLVPSNSKISKVICLGNITQSNETLKFLYNLSPSFNIVKGEFDDSQLLALELTLLSSTQTDIPLYQITSHDNLKIGFTNGYQIVPKDDPLSLLTLARELDVDILIWGGTHRVEAYTLDGKFFINPGSATGAFNFDWPERYEAEEEEEERSEQALKQNEKTETQGEEENEKERNEEQETGNGNEAAEEKETNEKSLEVDLEDPIPSFCLLDTNDSTCTLYIYTYLDGEVKVDKVSYTKEKSN